MSGAETQRPGALLSGASGGRARLTPSHGAWNSLPQIAGDVFKPQDWGNLSQGPRTLVGSVRCLRQGPPRPPALPLLPVQFTCSPSTAHRPPHPRHCSSPAARGRSHGFAPGAPLPLTCSRRLTANL